MKTKYLKFNLKPIYATVLLAFAMQASEANPLNPTVVNGGATFATTGNVLTVTNTPGAIINWQGFSIGASEITRFAQQSASSAVLNRVTGGAASNILGTLQSNGRVFLVNPSGIIFGAGSTVDVAGLVASSLNMSNADFMAGRYSFTQVPGAANISNAGNISAQSGGQIFLIAPNVSNTGVITAPNGEILLAAGHSVDLVSTNNPNLRVNITAPAGEATNVGQLIASSGSLGLFGAMVRNSGQVSADSVASQGGKIVFKASGRTEISGNVSASGTTGGTIQVLGNQVGVMSGASLSASGSNGGGVVLIGGDYQGKNPGVMNAQVTYIAPTASITADALLNGNGGKIIAWSDNTTRAYGRFSVRGGLNGGNGGLIETSGHFLDVAGIRVDAGAVSGATGNWLLDPTNINVVATASLAPVPDISTLATVSAFATAGPTLGDSNLDVALINAAAANVILQASNNITFSTAVNILAAGVGLTAQAGNSIILNAGITTNGGAITLTANDPTSLPLGLGTGSITGAGLLASGAGAIMLSAASITLPSITTTGAVSLNSTGMITQTVGGAMVAGAVTTSAAGGTTFAGTNTLASLDVQTGGLTGTGTLTVTGGTTTLNGLGKMATLNLSGGVLDGTGAVNVGAALTPGVMNWTGGVLGGAGILTVSGTLNVPGAAANPALLTTLALNKPLFIGDGVSVSQANFGSGSLNGNVQVMVGTGGSVTNQLAATAAFNNGGLQAGVGAGAFTNAGTVLIGPAASATPIAPIPVGINGGTNIPFVNNGGTIYTTNDMTFNGPVTFNGGSVIGGALFGATPVMTTGTPYLAFNGLLTIAGAAPLTLNGVRVETFAGANQGTVGVLNSGAVVLNSGSSIYNSGGTWTMNNAVYSLAPAITPAVTPLSGFYTMPGGAVTITALGTANFGLGVSFNSAGTTTLAGTLIDGNAVNTGALTVLGAYAGHLNNSGTLTVQAGANFAGDVNNALLGTINISGGTALAPILFQRSLYNGGTVNLSNTFVSINSDLMNAGTINMTNSTVSSCVVCLPGAAGTSFGNKGIVNVSGANFVNRFGMGLGGSLNGTIAASDVLTVNTKLGFTGAATLNNVTLATVAGTQMGGINNATPYTLTLQNGAIINNGSTWSMRHGDVIAAGLGVASVFNNLSGSILEINDVLAVTTPASINVAVQNSGSLNVLNGTLSLGGTFTGNTGSSVNISGGMLNEGLALSTPTLNLTGGTLNGIGSLTVGSSFTQAAGLLGTTFSSVNITQAAGDLTVGALGASGSINLTANTGAISVNGNINSGAGNVALSAVTGITQSADITANGNITLTASAPGGLGNYVQRQGLTSNTGTVTPGDITINAYDIQVGSTSSRRHVVLNAAHDIRIRNAGLIGGGTARNFHVDDASFAYTLPFGFSYYGVPYTTMYVSSNGVITFAGGSSSWTSNTPALMAGVQGLPTISPAWSDWVTYAPHDIYVHQPSANTLAVRWDVANFGNNSYTANFEAVLAQQGNVTFNYGAGTVMSPGYSAIIGVAKGDNLHYTISSLNMPASLNNLSSTTFNYNALTGNYVETLLGAGGNGGNGGIANNITAAANVTLNAANAISLINPITAATISAYSTNGITLSGLLNASGAGNAIVLDAGAGSFINNAGTTALTTAAGRWLVYSADPALDTFGGLISGNLPLWGRTTANYAPANVLDIGNRYLFSRVPVLSVSANGVKTYGTDLTLTPTTPTVSGLINAATYGNVFTQEAYTGTSSSASAGFAATAGVNAGVPYIITSSGNIVAPTGYGTTLYVNGQLFVNPFALTISAAGVNRVYNGTNLASVTLTDNRFAWDAAALTTSAGLATFLDKNVGNAKSVSVTGISLAGAAAGNYTFNTAAATTANITPAVLTVAATGVNKVYDATTTATVVLTDNRIAGDVLTPVYTGASFADVNVAAGKPVSVTGISLSGVDALNYTFNTTAATTASISMATATWMGGNGLWSNAANWTGGLVPATTNMSANIPLGSTVTYDLAAGVNALSALNSLGGFTMTGGTLNVAGAFNTAQYVQSAGSLTAGSVSISNAFSQTGGSLVATAGVTLNTVGAILQTAPGSMTAASLTASGVGGISLNGANRFNALSSVTNTVSGNVSVFNTAAPLTLGNVVNGVGSVLIDNIGAIVVSGASSSLGRFDLVAHSPITVNAGSSITSGGALTLTAGSAGSTLAADIITLNGTVSGTTVTLAANRVAGAVPAGAVLQTPVVAPAVVPVTVPTVVAPIVSTVVIPVPVIPFNPPVQPVLMQAPVTPVAAAPNGTATPAVDPNAPPVDPNAPDKKTAKDAVVVAAAPAPAADVAPAAPLPVCH